LLLFSVFGLLLGCFGLVHSVGPVALVSVAVAQRRQLNLACWFLSVGVGA
jgi:hypothetical protein